MTAAALSNGAPERPIGPGVGARLTLAWALAAGVPLLGGVLLAVGVLVVGQWSASRTAISLLIVSVIGLALGGRAMKIAGRSLVEPIEAVRAGQRRVQAGDLQHGDPGLRRQRARPSASRLQRDDRWAARA